MAHQSLYRKYRPQTFSDVVGQEHIERTLRNAVGDGTVAHAYLFCGPRGTGKTTTARILAKALNCEHGPTPDPDGTCQACLEIAEGRHPDVYELDAASRTGVDNVREEIIGRVQYAPTRGHYKVYIIDEVHMLSTAAFNALLKTLEEPPSHVVFVMATTHPHKVPETIQSRCQRFDFRRIGIDDIVGRLRVICDGEGFNVPDAALSLIARHVAGGMRDAITTLEQLASFTGGTITLDDVEGLLGEVDTAQLFEIAGLIARRDVAAAFRWVASFVEDGTDLAEFVRELTGHFRNLYVVAAVGDASGIVDAGSDDLVRLAEQAAEFGGPDRLARILTLLGELAAELRWSSDARLSLEVAFTRMARPAGEMTIESLADRIESLERGLSAGVSAPRTEAPPARRTRVEAAATAPPSAAPAARAEIPVAFPAQASEVPAAAPSVPAAVPSAHAEPMRPGEFDRAAAKRMWPDLLAEIKRRKPGRTHLFSAVDVDIDADGSTLVLEFPPDQSFSMQLAEDPEMRELIRESLIAVLGIALPVRMQIGRDGARSKPAASSAAASSAAPDVSAAHDASPEAAAPPADLAQFLMDGLGAKIVAEHNSAAAEPAGEAADASAPAEEYGFQDFMSLGDGMFDSTLGEDD